MLRSRVLAGFAVCLFAAAALAVVPPNENEPLRQREFRHPDLWWKSVYRPVAELPVDVARRLGSDLGRLGVDPGSAYFDRRTDRWGTLILKQPLIPGSGVGNTLEWSSFGLTAPLGAEEREQAAWQAFRRYLVDHVAELRIDPGELTSPRIMSQGERVIQIHVGRQVDGVPVRDTFVKATINSGNLVLLGQENWGDLALDAQPRLSGGDAKHILNGHLAGIPVSRYYKPPRLEVVPVSGQSEEEHVALGEGLEYRLVWVLTPRFDDDPVAAWEALVDAHDGELLAFVDTAHYASRRVEGSVLPVTNDGVPPDGVLQDGYPMPFADVALDGEPIGFTSTGGNVPAGADSGTISTELSGRFLTMNDTCGAVDESAATGDLDLEGVAGTDCAVPSGHSAGDTNSTRSGYYELNRIIEQGRGYLPDNGWLNQQLIANMNIFDTCNAGWNGSVNFFRSGGGCSNTGEIAGVFDHEWGHGMDNNDANPTISNPGEGIADIYAQNRLNTSCIGRNFRPGNPCNGYGDPCTECTGVRDTDWAKRQSGEPHDVAWIDTHCGGGPAPCGGSVHCEGAVYAEALWDLVHRDFMDFEESSLGLDLNTALELGTRLTYYGSSNVGNWYQCTTDGEAGCSATGGYLSYLAADDDNGDLNDGTPHMTAIHAAFDRHGIACSTPTVQNSGCAGAPATAPTNITATPFDEGAHLSWDPVAGAEEYWIYRTEGVHGCDFGKTRVGVTTETELVETGLGNDFEVLYGVVPVGSSDACTGPMSGCQSVTPEAGPGFAFEVAPLAWQGQTGDGDVFFDNCETGTVSFQITNTGVGALTNVRIVEATIESHPEAQIQTSLPAVIAASLAEGATAVAELTVLGGGFAYNDILELRVAVTSDELAPLALPQTYTLAALESDLQAEPSLTFSFEDGDDGWQLVSGVFDRTDAGGGADGTDFYRASSTNLNQSCDRIRSPLLQLSQTSTLEIYNQFDIEGMSGGDWWDRANLGIYELATGERTIVSPDGGRQYFTEDGTNPAPAPCASHNPPSARGWAGSGPAWGPSTWTATALGSADYAGQLVQLDVAYGTDPAALGAFGFWFDEVTVTDVSVQVPDGQADVCGPAPILTFDPTSLDFGDVPVGTQSPGEVTTLTNTGTADATALSFGTPGDGFVADSADCGATLAPEESCSISVTFTPPTLGPATATLSVNSGEGPSAGLDLSGNGVEEAPVFGPAGLQADPTVTTVSDGNGVFEPGELVVVAPEWRNDGTVAGALAGTAADFTGPSGTTYTVVEDGADYGDVAAGGTASCLDGAGCYELGLSDPAVRPATLWEATFEETLSDDSAKTWTLHIGDSFTDVPRSSPFYTAIETLLGSGVTGGCRAGDEYCPGSANSRAQMPVFMLRALLGADYTPPACAEDNPPFGDVPFDSAFCPWIQDLADRGIVSGCGDGDYCPGSPVSRAQMSIFLLKTLQGADYEPPACTEQFTDVPCPSLFADWIEDLAARGITGGCTETEYCPGDAVTRAQMAVFITKAFGFTLYGP